jgi:hypothetical protein
MAKTRPPKRPPIDEVPEPGRVRRTPRARALPGVDNGAIDAIEDCVGELADLRARRKELKLEERGVRVHLLELMKEHKRQTYERANGLRVRVVAGEAMVKIRLPKPPDGGDANDLFPSLHDVKRHLNTMIDKRVAARKD